MTLILAGEPAASGPTGAETAIPVDATLAVADTSEVLFTVPVGQRIRSFDLANVSGGNLTAHLSLSAGVAATTGDLPLERREVLGQTGLNLNEGTYEFIGGAGEQPRVKGVVWVGPA
jgi:hypothetical protein